MKFSRNISIKTIPIKLIPQDGENLSNGMIRENLLRRKTSTIRALQTIRFVLGHKIVSFLESHE